MGLPLFEGQSRDECISLVSRGTLVSTQHIDHNRQCFVARPTTSSCFRLHHSALPQWQERYSNTSASSENLMLVKHNLFSLINFSILYIYFWLDKICNQQHFLSSIFVFFPIIFNLLNFGKGLLGPWERSVSISPLKKVKVKSFDVMIPPLQPAFRIRTMNLFSRFLLVLLVFNNWKKC